MLGLFSDDEMDSSKVKSKESKIRFLEKIRNFVSDRLGISIDLRPSKVVAGLEPEKTCHFLQLFALMASNEQTVNLISNEEFDEKDKEETQKPQESPIIVPRSQSKDDIDDGPTELSPANSSVEKESKDCSSEEDNIQVEEAKDERKENPINDLIETTTLEENVQDCTPKGKTDSDPAIVEAREAKSIQNDDTMQGNSSIIQDEVRIQESELRDDVTNDARSEDISNNARPTSSAIKIENAPKEETEGVLGREDEDKEKASIERTFFGVDNFLEEIIVDDIKHSARPKTARRRPPRIKERVESAEKRHQHNTNIERPVIFKDDEGDKSNLTNKTGSIQSSKTLRNLKNER